MKMSLAGSYLRVGTCEDPGGYRRLQCFNVALQVTNKRYLPDEGRLMERMNATNVKDLEILK